MFSSKLAICFLVNFLKTSLFSSQNKYGTFQRSKLKHADQVNDSVSKLPNDCFDYSRKSIFLPGFFKTLIQQNIFSSPNAHENMIQ